MLSVAQAVHHPETPGSASKHSSLGHSWSAERPNMLKRRKTEQDCCIADKKQIKSSFENLTKQFNSQEITLTVIPKNNTPNDLKKLLQDTIKEVPSTTDEITNGETQEEKKPSSRLPTSIPAGVRSFLEKSDEVELMTVGSNENTKLTKHNENLNGDSTNEETSKNTYIEKFIDKTEKRDNFLDSHPIAELSEVTIEPCSSSHKTKVVKSPVVEKVEPKKFGKTHLGLERAKELLKSKENSNKSLVTSNFDDSFEENLKLTQAAAEQTFEYAIKADFAETVPEQTFDTLNYRVHSPLFDEETDHHAPTSTVADYEPFNVGISCDSFYTNNKDKPHYSVGFPNPPGENRCWTNATLQALFTLPIINRLDSFDIPESSKLLASLINVQKSWQKGNTGGSNFDQIFHTFKEELSALDKLYSSKAQQDVSEFVMNLLNFIKTEFESALTKESQSNEIENIPNNEQDGIWRPQNSTYESKRLPLSDISASAGQPRNNHLITYSSQQDISNTKTNSSPMKSKSNGQIVSNTNPIDDYFSVYMVENYICDGCSKQRQQKVENLMLFIDLPSEDHGTAINLIDMINTTFALEYRHMTCESCKHDMHSMVTKFKKLPKILIIQVKRYEMTNDGIITKKSTLVEIPHLLKLDSLIINNNQDFTHFPEYEPICIISHIGDNIDSGHYISFVKHENLWFYYDDMNVKLLSSDEVFKCIQNNAYLIFFQETELSQNVDTVFDSKNKKESITC